VELFVALDKIRICGLDSLETFNILMPNGKYTLRNEMSWKRVTLHLGLTIDMLPSSLDTAIFSGPTSSGVRDTIMLDVALDNLDVVASLLLVIKEEEMSLLTLGGLLRDDDFLACALSVFHIMKLSGLQVNADIVKNLSYNLTTTGSAGFTTLLQGAADAAYSLYKSVLETTAEAIFQRGVAAELNAIIEDLLVDAQASGCQVEAFITTLNIFRLFSKLVKVHIQKIIPVHRAWIQILLKLKEFLNISNIPIVKLFGHRRKL
jgi:hypothetical protein